MYVFMYIYMYLCIYVHIAGPQLKQLTSVFRFPLPLLPLFILLTFFFFFFSILGDEHAACSHRYEFSALASKNGSGNRPMDIRLFISVATKYFYYYIVATELNSRMSIGRFPLFIPLFTSVYFTYLFFSILGDEHAACSHRYEFFALASKNDSGNRPPDLSILLFQPGDRLHICTYHVHIAGLQ